MAEEMDEMYQLEHENEVSTVKETTQKAKGLKAKTRQLEEKDKGVDADEVYIEPGDLMSI